MQNWLPVFVAVTALAVVLQMAILLLLYLQFRRTAEQMARIARDLQSRVSPILMRLQYLVEDAQPRIVGMMTDVSDIVRTARGQAQRADRVFTESMDRLRLQLLHADRILTGVLEAIDDAGARVRRTLWEPVHQVSAFVKGVRTGLDFFRSHRRPADGGTTEQQDEGLFI